MMDVMFIVSEMPLFRSVFRAKGRPKVKYLDVIDMISGLHDAHETTGCKPLASHNLRERVPRGQMSRSVDASPAARNLNRDWEGSRLQPGVQTEMAFRNFREQKLMIPFLCV